MTFVSYNEQVVTEDDANQQLNQLIPRGVMSIAAVWRYQNYRPLLALPPSTNCPVSFKEMYRSATTTVQRESDGGGGLKQQTKNKNNNKRQKNPTNDSGDSCVTTLVLLHEDVIPQILSYCDAITLSRASCVCKSWYKLANADDLWTTLCKEVFGILPIELRPPPDPTRLLYILSYLKLRETLSFGSSGGGRSRRHGMGGAGLFITDSIPAIFHVG
jgi:hypothetical protein